MNMPSDPVMLLSFINMKLRDGGCNLEQFCDRNDVDAGQIISALAEIGYSYNAELNQFK